MSGSGAWECFVIQEISVWVNIPAIAYHKHSAGIKNSSLNEDVSLQQLSLHPTDWELACPVWSPNATYFLEHWLHKKDKMTQVWNIILFR